MYDDFYCVNVIDQFFLSIFFVSRKRFNANDWILMQMLCIFFFCECVFYERILNFRSLMLCVSVWWALCASTISVCGLWKETENSEMTVYVVHTVLRIYVLCQQAVMRQRNYWNEWDQNVNKEEQLDDDDVVVGKSTWRKCVYNFVNDCFTHWEKPQRCKSNADIKSPHSFPHVCISSKYDIPPTRTSTNRNSNNNNK